MRTAIVEMFRYAHALLLYRGINDTDSNAEKPSEGGCIWCIYFFFIAITTGC